MDPITILALLDGALTITERAPAILAELLRTGQITVEQQQERLNRIERSRQLSGHVSPPTG